MQETIADWVGNRENVPRWQDGQSNHAKQLSSSLTVSLIFFWRFQLGLKESWKVSLRVHQEVSLRAKEKPKKKHEDGEILEADML